MHMQEQPIGKIMKRFKDEWLLIRVMKFDRKRTLPLTGKLIAHSKDRFEIEQRDKKQKALTLTIFSGPPLPEGYAAAF